MTVAELRNGLYSFKRATVVSFTAHTTPKMSKKGNPFFGGVTKVAHVNGMINFIYESSVNRQRLREDQEPDFSAFPRAWGTRIRGTPLVEHEGNHYLEVKVEKVTFSYLFNGQPIAAEQIEPFLTPPSPGRQGVDKPVVLRDYKLDNIRQIRWDGKAFDVVPGNHPSP